MVRDVGGDRERGGCPGGGQEATVRHVSCGILFLKSHYIVYIIFSFILAVPATLKKKGF